MASRFQRRLVGMIVLVAVGVIILPDVFDGKKSHYTEEVASIPLKPELNTSADSYKIAEPKKPDASLPKAPVQAADSAAQSATEPKIATTSVPAKADSGHSSTKPVGNDTTAASVQQPQTQPQSTQTVAVTATDVTDKNGYNDSAWIIQLMALKNDDNAKTLVADLQKRGYQAHTKRENGFTRIIIGPDVSKEKLEKQLVELDKITGSKGRLIKFQPLNP